MSDINTLGVEEEYLLFNTTMLTPAKLPPNLVDALVAGKIPAFSTEIFDSLLEGRTPVCDSVADLRRELKKMRHEARKILAPHGLTFIAAGTSPTHNWRIADKILPAEAASRFNAFGDLFQSQLIAALHIHTKVGTCTETLEVMNHMSWFTWLFAALAGSSPFYDGRDTGVQGRRLSLVGQTHRIGLPPHYTGEGDYDRQCWALEKSGWSANKLWYFIRYNANHGTLELRICDSLPDVEDATAIAALFLLMVRAVKNKRLSGRYMGDVTNRVFAEENIDRAMCLGTDEIREDGMPVRYFNHRLDEKPLMEILDELWDIMADDVNALGLVNEMAHLRKIIRNGNSAARQRDVFHANGNDLQKVVEDLHRRTHSF